MKSGTVVRWVSLVLGILLACTAAAQGTFNANNNFTPGGASTKAFILDETGNVLAKAKGRVEVLFGNTTLSPKGTAGVPLTLDGLFFINGLAVPGVPTGGTATLAVRAWDVSSGATYDTALVRAMTWVTITSLGGGTTPPATFGNNSDFKGLRLQGTPAGPEAPKVVSNPVAATITEGQTLTLSASITGIGVSYVWQKDGSNLSDGGRILGAKTQTLSVSGVVTADAGQYRLVGVNAAGTTTTAAAAVTVVPTPFLSQLWALSHTTTETSAVAIDDATGRVVVQTSNPGRVTCVDITTGDILWEVAVSGRNRSSPTIVSGGRVVFGSDALPNGWVYGHGMSSGEKLWERNLGGAPSAASFDGSDAIFFGTVGNHLGGANQYVRLDRVGNQTWKVGAPVQSRTCPVILKSGLLVYGGGSFNTLITAVRASDGGKAWSFDTGGEAVQEPAFGPGGRILATSRSGKLFALNASTGAKIWEAIVGTEPGSPICDAAGRVYVGARGGKILAFNGSTGAKIWEKIHGEVSDNPILSLDNQGLIWCGGDKSVIGIQSTDGSVAGRYAVAGGVASVMIAKGGILVACTGKGAAAFRTRGVTGLSSDSPWPTWRHDSAGTSFEGFTLAVTAPTVAASPSSTTITAGQTLTLTASILGEGVAYRWQKNGVDLVDGGRISGATTQTLTLTGVTLSDGGPYRLVGSNSAGSVTTAAANVMVQPAAVPPVIIASPQSVAGIEGDRIVLSVTAFGDPAPNYRWMKDGVMIEGQTSSTLELLSLRSADAGSYRAIVANSGGTVASAEAIVTWSPGLEIFADGQPVQGTLRTASPVSLELRYVRPDWILFYTEDGTAPDFLSTPYGGPFGVVRAMDLRIVAYSPDFSESRTLPGLAVRFVQPQTLGWSLLPTLRYLEKGVVAATASSGLPVAIRVVSGPATLTNGELTATGVGQVVLRAVQPGNDQFAAAMIDHTMTIQKAVQSLTWPTLAGKTFGDAPFNAAVVSSSGLPVTLVLDSGKATMQGATLTLTGAGRVLLTASQAGNSLYEAISDTRTIEVAKAAQTITFPALADRPYTPAPFAPVATASSKLSVSFVVFGPAQLAGDTVSLTGVGAVTLRAIQSGNDNYLSASPVERTFTVTKAPQTITWGPFPGGITFGDPAVKLVATSSAGLEVAFRILSGPGIIDGQMFTAAGAGTVVIQAFNAGNALYQAGAAPLLNVVVAKAPQTIAFTALPDVPYSTNPIAITAAARSQLPVSYRLVGGPATLSGDRLKLTGVGVVSVAVDQAGNANWLAAPSVTNRFAVTRGIQTLTFDAIPDQVVGNPPITLQAVSSVGLPMLFEIVSGPATVAGKVLTLTGPGRVTVRARQVGSPLWLPAQTNQSFEVIQMTVLTVAVVGNQGGTVTVAPSKAKYLPTETVTLTAIPVDGFRFEAWSGDVAGTENPKSLSMLTNRVVTAAFKDVAPPVLAWATPKEGTSPDQTVRIAGVVTDNVGVASLRWSRDGGTALDVAVDAKGAFSLENVLLSAGANRIRLTATDATGNITSEERSMVWEPERVLQVVDAAPVQEGQRVSFPILLRTRKSDVAGATFRLEYDTAHLADPQVEWIATVGQSVNSVNMGTAGVVSGSFALAGNAIPSGSNLVATVSFRARSVPFSLVTPVIPRIESIASPTGAFLNTGNIAEQGGGRITPRKIKGDNNANQRLDVGDAVVISRLQVSLEESRSWDLPLNDLNASGNIDSGDVVKVLRVVVGMDPQPKAAPRSGGGRELGVESGALRVAIGGSDAPESLEGTGGAVSQLSTLHSQPNARRLRPAGANTNDVATLEFPEGPVAQVGKPYRVVVRLTRASAAIAGLSFTVNYPSALTLTDKQVGALVPADALPLWAESVGSVNLAAVRSTIWPTSTGVAAVLTFLPTAAINAQAAWPIELVKAEVTGAGFDIRALDNVTGEIRSLSTPPTEPKVVVPTLPTEGGPLALEVEAAAGAAIVLETTTDLGSWSEAQRLTGQGAGKPVRVTVTPDPNARARFWRVRVP